MLGNHHANGQANGALPDLIVAHTSDLHIGGRARAGEELWTMRAVLDAAEEAGALALILAGDIFDNNRVPGHIVEGAARMLGDAVLPVVILPGNHDPATPDTVYRRSGLSDVPNVHVLGVSAGASVRFADLELEICGVPHVAYVDMSPLATCQRSMRWHIIVAHGHWVRGPHDAHRGWLMHDYEIAATDADYVALGHWDVPQRAGDGSVPAYYSGSPEIAKTVNIVRLAADEVEVRRHPLRLGR